MCKRGLKKEKVFGGSYRAGSPGFMENTNSVPSPITSKKILFFKKSAN